MKLTTRKIRLPADPLLRRGGSNSRPPTGGYEPKHYNSLISARIQFLPVADFNCFSLCIAFALLSKISLWINFQGRNLIVQPFVANSLCDFSRLSKSDVYPI